MRLDAMAALADYEATHPPAPTLGPEEPDIGEGDALKAFLAETGLTRDDVAVAVDAYLNALPDAVSGQGGQDQAFKAARAIRYGFDLGADGGWEAFCEWNKYKCDPPFDDEAEGGPDSLRRKWRECARTDHTKAENTRGYLLRSNRILQERAARRGVVVVPQPQPGEPWSLDARPLSQFLGETYPRPELIVGPFIKGAICFLYGSAGSLKTWLALEVMRQAAEAGHSTVYVLEEGMPFIMQQRFANLEVDPARVHISLRRKFDIMVPAKVDALIAYAKAVGASLIVLDPFSDCSSADENERREMLVVRQALDRIVKETGACLLVVHHSNKAGGRQGKADLGADMANMRGSSVLMGAVDLMLELRRLPESEGAGAEVHMTKNRNFAMELPGTLMLVRDGDNKVTSVRWTYGEEARKEYDAKKKAKAARATQKVRDDDNLDHAIFNVVGANPGITLSKLSAQIVRVNSHNENPPSKSKVERHAKNLLNTGHLKNVGEGQAFALVVGKRLLGVDCSNDNEEGES